MSNPQQIPPEVLQAYMRQLTQEQQDQDLQNQMAMAHELMKQGPQRYGAWGSGLQAAADMFNAYRGGRAIRDAQGQRQQLRGTMESDRNTIAQHWLQSQQPQQMEPGMAQAYQGPTPQMVTSGEIHADAMIPELLRAPAGQQGLPNLGVQKVPPPISPDQIQANAAAYGG